jgi:hypothetical protein
MALISTSDASPEAVRLLSVSLSSLQNEADVDPQLDLPIQRSS